MINLYNVQLSISLNTLRYYELTFECREGLLHVQIFECILSIILRIPDILVIFTFYLKSGKGYIYFTSEYSEQVLSAF